MPRRLLLCLLLLSAVLRTGAPRHVGAQDAKGVTVDFAALALRPGDIAEPGWRHEGAFMEDLASEAEIVAGYRGEAITSDEVAEQLRSFGWRGMYVNTLSFSADNAAAPPQRARSYITEFASADGAADGFAFLEDESSAAEAEDIPTTRTFGEQSELTSEEGVSGVDGRRFRSLDLTFRVGNLTAGVNLITYGTESAGKPDTAAVEALAQVLESRLLAPSKDGNELGATIVRFAEGGQLAITTYDDAYYRISGSDIPLVDESDESAELRTGAYADAIDVYQLWQGINVGSADGALYGVTTLRFADEAEATVWFSSLETTLAENPFYGSLRPMEIAESEHERVALSYVAGGGSPDAPRGMLVAVRVGSVVTRVHLVPQGGLNDVALTDVQALAELAAGCLTEGACPELTNIPTHPTAGGKATPDPNE